MLHSKRFHMDSLPQSSKKDSIAWRQCRKFCKWLEIPADLQGIGDPIPFLQIFAERIHAVLLKDIKTPIKKRSVEQ